MQHSLIRAGLELKHAASEGNALDEFGQAVLAIEFSPFPQCAHHQLEGQEWSDLAAIDGDQEQEG